MRPTARTKGFRSPTAGRRRRRATSVVATLAVAAATVLQAVVATAPAHAVQAAPGAGFTVTAGDLSFILKQIKIAERHSATLTASDPCGTLVGPNVNQIPDRLSSYGLRTVDGSCNNLFAGREKFAAADQVFPRYVPSQFRDAEPITPDFPVGPPGPTSYKQKQGSVVDSQPRTISNLIVDQTSTNPAAIAAAAFPVRTQGNPGLHPCTTDPDPTAVPPVDGVPAGCVPSHKTLFIPNVTTDVGLSPPYNSLFTFFGQFFDHGVDQTVKSGASVFVPLKADDPLRTLGPDGKPNTGDEVPASQAFMVLTRAQNQPGPDGILGTTDDVQNASNTDSPWVDQSQTYTSHASHQAFLREYTAAGPDGIAGNADDALVSTGKLLGGLPAGQTYLNSPDGTDGISTWAAVKKQAAQLLGLRLLDKDVTNIPMLATDPYGEFIPGPDRGLPQYVLKDGTLVEGDLASPVPVPDNVQYFDTPFLTDIAHNADPSPQDTDHDPATPPVAPVPDADNTPSANFAAQPAGTYDDEMLDAHFACGDGRCNENIALSTIHQIFHSEHDRLVDDIKGTLAANPSLDAAYKNVTPNATDDPHPFTYGDRLFQAARFVTEMEYQHLVFEEFARKVQPAVKPFHVYSPDINPAIHAEFAHAVYRFGHSMLDDDVARTNVNPTTGAKSDNSLPLLKAFLNPPEYFNGGTAGTLTPQQAAGSIVMGSSDQVGNELDEFVTETLRNNLLGLPLDLAAINMTRAREAGVPPLNQVRRKIFADTGDSALAPYSSWTEFGQHLKHPESLINFVAAYGQHPSITGATTLADKRAAARAIVDPSPGNPTATPPVPADVPPADAADFMFGTGAWANDANGTTTGLDDVDLWVGGLAEVTNLNGGLLGSTFNYVFQSQLEDLQDGDRLYYLNRTPGMNLRTQLESNSFSEMIQRNTDGTNTLKADAFATADCKFQLANITSPYDGSPTVSQPGLAPLTGSGSVNDDPTTPCDENQLLIKLGNGTVQYRAINKIDPSGINGQSVYNGTPGDDKVAGGNDNDTFWGGNGADRIEGQGGDDVALGGPDNDILSDLDGADVSKGGAGNDAIDGGPGDDISMGGDGQDFMNGGLNDNESFAGPGNDFVIAGAGADAVFGDGGDDWIQGGLGQDLLQGDHGAPFFDDPAETAPGNDIFVGQAGENDYDTEGGDDIMSQNAAIDRNAGAGGFDWAIHQYDTVGADDDMKINQQLAGLPLPVVVNRDRWQETEADSGSRFDDVLRGDDMERVTGGFGFSGCDALDPAGVARIGGLNKLVTSFPSPLQPVFDVSPFGFCPLVGDGGTAGILGSGNVWAEGNILLGGGGNDVIEGRGNNDIIDGDHALSVGISVRTNPADPATELGRTDLMEHQATSGNFGPGTAGMTLQQAVTAGLVDPGNLVAVRGIDITGATPDAARAGDCPAPSADGTVHPLATTTNCDTALYSQAPSAYTITANADGSVTVADNAFVAAADLFAKGDGIDTLWNIENLRFCLGVDAVTKKCNSFTDVSVAPSVSLSATSLAFAARNVGTTSVAQNITVRNTGIAALKVTGVTVTGANPGQFTATPAAGCASVPGGGSCTVAVRFAPTTAGALTASVNIISNASGSPHSVTVSGTGLAVVPGAPVIGTAVRGNASATVNWSAPTNNGGSAITGYLVRVIDAAGAQVGALRPADATATSLVVTGLTNGSSYRFQVRATNAVGTGASSATSNAVVPGTVPDAPGSVTATRGNRNATVTWTAPSGNGSAITSYDFVVKSGATVISTTTGIARTAVSRTVTGLNPGQNYTFEVRANNAIGAGPFGVSNEITAAGTPAAPTALVATRGNASATLSWTPGADNASAITGYTLTIRNGATVVGTRSIVGNVSSAVIDGLNNGTSYNFRLQAINGIGTGALSAASNAVTPATLPGLVQIGAPTPGAPGGALTASANWTAPLSNGGSAITGYRVVALRMAADGTTVAAVEQNVVVNGGAATTRAFTLPAGTYRFDVSAINGVGEGPPVRSEAIAAQ